MSLRHLAPSVAVLAVLAVPAAAPAQIAIGRTPGDTLRYTASGEVPVPYYEARRAAYDRGYREGLKRGEQDARRGSRFGYHDVRDFQRADKGYHRSFGDRERYRQVFRDGYASGYSDGYARIAGYARGGRPRGPVAQGGYGTWGSGRYGTGPYATGPYGARYASPGFDNGLRDGYEKGIEDARRNRVFDPIRHSWYRAGDRHYRSEYGPREQYKDFYRRGFQQGYERGYQEGRYRY